MQANTIFVRFISFFLCLFMLAWSAAACGSVSDYPESESDSETVTETEDLQKSSLYIAGHPIEEFKVIRAETAGKDIVSVCSKFRNRISELYGFEMEFETDYVPKGQSPSPYEIVVGSAKREGAPSLTDKDQACLCVKEGRLYVLAQTGDMLDLLIDYLIRQILTDEKGQIVLTEFEEGYMKEFKGTIQLRRTDGNPIRTDVVFKTYAFGVTGHNRGYEAYPEALLESQIRAAAELGSKIYRFNFNPESEDDFRYMKVLDTCDTYGLQMMLVLDDFQGDADEIAERNGIIAQRLKGRVAYYQVFNETDVYAMYQDDGSLYNGGTGEDIRNFNPSRMDEMTEKFKKSIDAIRQNDPNGKIVINFAYKHIAILEHYAQAGITWDVTGVDWYSDMEATEPLSSFLVRAQGRLPDTDYMICECNIWAHQDYTEEEQSEYLEQFVLSLKESEIQKLKAILIYELLDEPAYGNGESHFGLIKCDRKGNIEGTKKAYDYLQLLLCGGKTEAVLVLEEKE